MTNSPTPKPTLERVVLAGGWAFFARTLQRASGFLRTVVLARLLTPHDFGVMGTAMVIISAIEAFTSTGFEAALVQRPTDVDEFYDSVFSVQILRGFCLGGIVWLIAPLAAAFFDGPVLVPVLRATGLVLVLRGLVNPARLRLVRELQYKTLFWWSLPEAIVSLALAITFGFLLRNVWALVITFLGSQVTATAVSYALAKRPLHLRFQWSQIGAIIHYSKWVFATHIVDFLLTQGDNAFIAKALGIAELGFYQVAFRVAELPLRGFTQVVADVALPGFSRVQREHDAVRQLYSAAQRLVLAVQLLFALPVLLLGAPLVGLLLGARWEPIVPTLKILAVAMVLRSFLVLASTLFNALGEPRYSYQIHVARLIVMTIAIYPLSRLFGVPGVAASVLVGLGAALVLYFPKVRTMLNVRA